jgi:hypothetical protein
MGKMTYIESFSYVRNPLWMRLFFHLFWKYDRKVRVNKEGILQVTIRARWTLHVLLGLLNQARGKRAA